MNPEEMPLLTEIIYIFGEITVDKVRDFAMAKSL